MRVRRWTTTLRGVLSSERDARIQKINGESWGEVVKKKYVADLSDVDDENSVREETATEKDADTEAELSSNQNVSRSKFSGLGKCS